MIRDTSKVLSSFEAALPAINNGHFYMLYLQKLNNDSLKLSIGNLNTFVKLTSTTKIELCWWDKHLTCSQDIFTESPKLTISSDACSTGWGAACLGNSTGANWTPEEFCFHINTLEMAAALYDLKIYTRDVSNFLIQVNVDNTSSLVWINKKTAPNEAIFLTVKEFWGYCMGINLEISKPYMNTNENKVADKESRKLRNNLEWSLQT